MVGGGQGWAGLAESVAASSLSMSAGGWDCHRQAEAQGGFRLRAVRSSAFVQTAFCQEGFQGEDEPEQAFKVQSREAIHTISCRVDDRSR